MPAKEHPILMSKPMVIATLEDRKSQTRRITSWPIMSKSDGAKKRVFLKEDLDLVNTLLKEKHRDPMRIPSCPYGRIGEKLWVRESHHRFTGCAFEGKPWEGFVESPDGDPYKARCYADSPILDAAKAAAACIGVPSIFMPRWFSRITLEITDVRIQKLQDISEEDAKAEGVEPLEFERYYDSMDFKVCPQCGGTRLYTAFSGSGGALPDTDCTLCDTYVKRYKWLWESINGTGSWDLNPYVWCVSFRKVVV